MSRIPAGLMTDLAEFLRARHADGLYAATIGLLGDQLLSAPREDGVPAQLDTATVTHLIEAYSQQGHLAVLAPVLELLEPYLPILQRSEPIVVEVLPIPSNIARNIAASLTNREIQVLVGMANGMSNPDIGKSLFLTDNTIKTHARRIFRKLGAVDRAHAVSMAYRAGVLPVRRSVEAVA